MKKSQQTNWTTFIKRHLIESIENHEGSNVYGCDLAYLLTESVNADGTYFYSADKTKQHLKKFDEVCGEFVEYYFDNFGEYPANHFIEPEKFHVQMIIISSEILIGSLPIFKSSSGEGNDLWNEQITLDKKMINKIKRQIREFDETIF